MAKFCPECANPIVENNMPFCPKCGAKLPVTSSEVQPPPVQEPAVQQPTHPSNYTPPLNIVPSSSSDSNNTERSFKYSAIFYLVTVLDLIFTFILSLAALSIVISGKSPGPQTIIFGIFWFVGFITDIYLLNKVRTTPHTIDINSCWIKCLFGFLGIFTIITGLYFLIVSFKMKRAYDSRIK
jgi:hypothetical protein